MKKNYLMLTHRDNILQKIQSGSSHVTHHTSHITNCMWNCKFYKILRIIVVVHFGKSLRLNRNMFMKYFLIKIIVLTIQIPRSRPELLNLNILWWKTTSSKKLGFAEKSKNFNALVFFFRSVWYENQLNKQRGFRSEWQNRRRRKILFLIIETSKFSGMKRNIINQH